MPSKYGIIYTDSELKDLLFDVVSCMHYGSYGKSSTWSTLSLIEAVGKGNYFTQSKNTGFAKYLAVNEPEISEKLRVFFYQNDPTVG
ncbi:MAG: hypothetical protein ACRYGG_07650 [Janthinobacterium lividum]